MTYKKRTKHIKAGKVYLPAILAAIVIMLLFWLLLNNAGFWQTVFVYVNICAFCCYGIDKYLAVNSRRRIPEYVLFILAIVGGVPGSIAGQQLFRHKTQKRQFQVVFFSIVVLQAAMLTFYWFMKR